MSRLESSHATHQQRAWVRPRAAHAFPALVLVSMVLAACNPQGSSEGASEADAKASAESAPPPPMAAATGDTVEFAVAHLKPTAGNTARGVVRFERADEGVRMTTEISGLPGGKHAHHVHVWGDCSGADGKTAGTHFNFQGSTLNLPDDAKRRITGDLGDLEPAEDGTASVTRMLPTAQLDGPLSILGRSVIVHAKGNDHSQPPIGAAGSRLACGVIGASDGPG